jgi:hypothetical protein
MRGYALDADVVRGYGLGSEAVREYAFGAHGTACLSRKEPHLDSGGRTA